MNALETDAALVLRVRAGSRDAAGCLAERYLRAARAVALSVVRDVDLAEDVCQDAFVYAMSRIDECRDPARFGGWLLTIVRNRGRNCIRARGAARAAHAEAAFADESRTAPDPSAEQIEARERLLAALGLLSEVRRSVLLLHDLEGWTHDEIAGLLDLPSGTVRSHLHYARKRVRTLLERSVVLT